MTDTGLIVSTFSNPRPPFPRGLANPWGVGMTGTTYYISEDGKIRVKIQDSSQITTGLSSVRQSRRRRGDRRVGGIQKGGITPADIVRSNRLRARMPGLGVPNMFRPSGHFGAASRQSSTHGTYHKTTLW